MACQKCLNRVEVGEIMERTSERKEEPGKMGSPFRIWTTRFKSGFQTAVETFNHSIGLRVECSGGDVVDVEEGGKVSPNRGRELQSFVGVDDVRKVSGCAECFSA